MLMLNLGRVECNWHVACHLNPCCDGYTGRTNVSRARLKRVAMPTSMATRTLRGPGTSGFGIALGVGAVIAGILAARALR